MLRLSGSGVLDADIKMGAIKSQLSDRLSVPAQTIELSGRAVITKATAAR